MILNRTPSILLLPAVVLAFIACNAKTLVVADDSDGGASSSSSSGGALPNEEAGTATCCPRDQALSGCMSLGGSSTNGCGKSCDFFCSTNWRVETNADGCEVWRYDVRQPAAGENAQCLTDTNTGAAECPTPCKTNEVCVKTQQVGGVLIPPDDGGTCPPGRHVEGQSCELDPAFACVPKPSACGGGALSCGCASDVCTSISSCQYQCQSTSADQVNCLCQVP
jgi:hypothetical protein